MHILLNPTLCQCYNDYAHQLLCTYFQQFGAIYGKDQLVYNVHGLIHLSNDAKRFGPLDNISSFPYENFLHKLKRLIRKPSAPLQQVIRRLSEEQTSCLFGSKGISAKCKKENMDSTLPPDCRGCQQYSELQFDTFSVSRAWNDSCIKVNGSVGVVRNISLNERIIVVYESYQEVDNFCDYPLPSGC